METEAERIAALHEIDEKLRDYTAPFITPILGVISLDEGEVVGSGFFASIKGVPHLVTAAHVALEQRNPRYSMLAHSRRNGGTPAVITESWCIDRENDVAFVRLDAESIGTAGIVGEDMFAVGPGATENDVFFLHGFPARQSRFTRIGQGVISDSLAYGTFLRETQWGGFDPARHFALQYEPEPQQRSDGRMAFLPEAGGLSGTGVWKANYFGNPHWVPSDAKLVGVVHRFDGDKRSVVASHVEALRGMADHFYGLGKTAG